MFRSQGADRELLPEPFVDGGAERLNQIAGQGFAAKAGPVVKAEQRVEAGAELFELVRPDRLMVEALAYDPAIGAAMAEPERTVICFSGDGSILMNLRDM